MVLEAGEKHLLIDADLNIITNCVTEESGRLISRDLCSSVTLPMPTQHPAQTPPLPSLFQNPTEATLILPGQCISPSEAQRHALLFAGSMASVNGSGFKSLLHLTVLFALLLLMLFQLLVGLLVPRAYRTSAGFGPEDEPDFTVISIKNDGSARESKSDTGDVAREWSSNSGGELWTEEEPAGQSTYEKSERSTHQAVVGVLNLQPWASGGPSFNAEVQRLIHFITSPQMKCASVQSLGKTLVSTESEVLCLNYWTDDEFCVAYSFSLDGKDAVFLETALRAGCEVHRFDPSRSEPNSGSGSPAIWHHQIWLDWRSRPHGGMTGIVPRRLPDIMGSLGHNMIDVLWANLESAEWRVLESWFEDGTLRRINQLILTIHLQWAGFEVSGSNEEVVRFWYSVLSALYSSGFRLVRSSHGPGRSVLRHTLPNTHSSYTLNWVRTKDQQPQVSL
ncbi:methyltransferase-like protein 24 [Chanos chanos]|uniref:Methyltransferase-like protein 24 n=1 Tax=Chanos chanos TaxID=29144 RepID=A0A6J2WJD0_CHACN|nr:methyltransferase-like protein 24 [Chanos chanos]